MFLPRGVIGALPLTIIVLTLNFPLHQCTEYHDTVGPNFSTRDASPWIQLFKGCSATSHFSTFCLNTSKYSILLKCILCRWLYHIYGWGSVHCIEDAPNTGSSAWLISRLGHYSLTAASRSVFDICPDQREGADQRPADQHLTRIQERQTFIALTKLQSTPKSIWQLPCGLATCVANVCIVYPLLRLYTTFLPDPSNQENF